MQQGNSVTHQMMGYDRASMFSPDGRLFQVEYAKKTVKQGTAVLGMVCSDGVLLVADRRVLDRLIVSQTVEKIFQVDDHISAAACGIMSDGRILIEKSQLLAQQHKVTYDEPIEVRSLVKDICNTKQSFTQYGGARPFGVSLLYAGVDDKPRLFMSDPTGVHWEYRANAIGEYEDELKEILLKEYKETMTVEEGLKLGVGALKTVLGKEFSVERLDGSYIKSNEKKFHRITKEGFKKILRK